MVTKVLSASAFKAKCLALMDEVAETGEAVIITKNGKPVAQLGPAPGHARGRKPAFGLHKGLVTPIGDPDLDAPMLEAGAWTADADNLK